MRAAQNDMTEAFELSRALTRDHPDSALAWFVRGALLARGASLREAQDALEHATALAPKQLDVMKQVALLVTLIDVQIANRDIEKARVTAAVLARVAPDSPIAAITSARVMMASNDFASAAVELRKVVNRAPQFARARFLLGVALAAEGSLSQANQELTTVVEQTPNNMEARQLLAQVRMRLEDPDSALRVLVPALDGTAGNNLANQLFDAARMQVGDSDRSLALIERAYQTAPDNQGLKLQLAAAYVRDGQGAKALALLGRAPATARDPLADRILLAATAQAEGEAAARRKLDQMLAARPDDPDLVLFAAQMHMGAREDARARQLLEARSPAIPNIPNCAQALARVQLMSGERAAAVENLDTDFAAGIRTPTNGRLMLAQLALMRDDAKEAAHADCRGGRVAASVPAEIHNSAGLIYLGTARFDSAGGAFPRGHRGRSYPIRCCGSTSGRAQLALEQHEAAARQSLERALVLRANWLPAEGALAFLELQSGTRPPRSSGSMRCDRATERRRRPGAGRPRFAPQCSSTRRPIASLGLAGSAGRPSVELAVKTYQLRVAGQLPKAAEPLETWVAGASRTICGCATCWRGACARRTIARRRFSSTKPSSRRAAARCRGPEQPRLAVFRASATAEAVETARKAVALAPDSPAVADTLGWILVQAGHRARRPARSCSGPRKPTRRNEDMQYHYAAALAKSGQAGPRPRSGCATLLAGKNAIREPRGRGKAAREPQQGLNL